jgi:hypothetical protein
MPYDPGEWVELGSVASHARDKKTGLAVGGNFPGLANAQPLSPVTHFQAIASPGG